MDRTPKPVTKKQKRTLPWLLNLAGLDDGAAREYLETVCGKRRKTDMNFYDYQRAIDGLNDRLGNPLKSKYRPGTGARPTFRPKPATPRARIISLDPGDQVTDEQREFMFDLYHQIGATNVRRQRGIAEKAIGKPWPNTVGEAQKVIEALKHMQRRGYKMGDEAAEPAASKTEKIECGDNCTKET